MQIFFFLQPAWKLKRTKKKKRKKELSPYYKTQKAQECDIKMKKNILMNVQILIKIRIQSRAVSDVFKP